MLRFLSISYSLSNGPTFVEFDMGVEDFVDSCPLPRELDVRETVGADLCLDDVLAVERGTIDEAWLTVMRSLAGVPERLSGTTEDRRASLARLSGA
jgi:hypothetical protein